MNNSRSFRVLLFQQQPKISYAYDQSFRVLLYQLQPNIRCAYVTATKYKIYAVLEVRMFSGRDPTNHKQRISLLFKWREIQKYYFTVPKHAMFI
jgi:hypothetical protein